MARGAPSPSVPTPHETEFETAGAFARAYRVNPYLLPWGYRDLDLAHVGGVIGDVIASLRPTKVGFTVADLVDASDRLDNEQAGGRIPVALFLAHGAYPIPGADRPTRYANPGYVHRHADSAGPRVTDPAERREWLWRYAMLGPCAPPETIVTHFGLAAEYGIEPSVPRECVAAVGAAAAACDFPWASRRVAGDGHMGRVFVTTFAWTPWTPAMVAGMYAVSPRVVMRLVAESCDRGFVPPGEPSKVSPRGEQRR